ncbi:MAG TPA: hypothetical protein VHB50_04085 [Bryobacteraceae bacterium]|nr:hypothetical protein [Bryobacteraceae bacterium]
MTHTRPIQVGSTLPSACASGELFFDATAASGENLYACVGSNMWGRIGENATIGTCTVNLTNNSFNCPGGFLSGDGAASGQIVLFEQAANGQQSISLAVPASIPAGYTLQLPASYPLAGQAMQFSAPDQNGVAQATWVPVVTRALEQQFFPAAGGDSTGYILGPNWSLPVTGGASLAGGGTPPYRQGVVQFASGVKQTAVLATQIPEDWDGTTIVLKLYWSGAYSTGDKAKLEAAASCVNDGQGDVASPLFNPAVSNIFTAAAAGGNARTTTALILAGSALAGCSGGSLFNILVDRDGTDVANDTMAGTVNLLGASVSLLKKLQ